MENKGAGLPDHKTQVGQTVDWKKDVLADVKKTEDEPFQYEDGLAAAKAKR
jgi:hypothetical protein